MLKYPNLSISYLNEMEECSFLSQYPDFPKELIPSLTDPKTLLCLWWAHPEFHVLELTTPGRRWQMLIYALGRKTQLAPVMVEKLLQSGYYDPAELGTLLSGMSLYGRTEMVKLLLKYGADPNDDRGAPLLNAVDNNYPEIVELLLDAGANIHTGGVLPRWHTSYVFDAPLMIAIYNNNLEMVKLLLDHGADIHGGDPLTISIGHNNLEMVKLLLNHGANANLYSSDTLYDVISDPNMNPEILIQLLEHGADPNDRDFIHDTIYFGEGRGLGPLLEHGARITPDDLLVAIKMGNYDAVKLLLQYGADPNKPDGKPLKDALANQDQKIANLLIQYGAT